MNQKKGAIKEDEIDLREIFMMFVKRKWWFIGAIIITILIGSLYIFTKPSNYMVTYQIKVNEEYGNDTLSKTYPDYTEELNFFTLSEIPTIFSSEEVFKSVNSLAEEIDSNKLRESEAVKIVLNKDTSIFNINVSNPDYDLANEIAKTLINSFEGYIENKEVATFDEVLSKIKIDIKNLEDEREDLKNVKIASLKKEIDNLYAELNRYIVDYNVGLLNELEESKKGQSNYSFYNVIVPPNKISYEISAIQREIDVYENDILKSESEILVLNDLHKELSEDEDIILDRVELVSEDPMYEEVQSNKMRNIAIVLVLSIMIGIIVTFVVNFLLSLRSQKY